MKEAVETKKRGRGRPSRWPGICRDAETLGVTRTSLWRALSGHWELPKLVARYEALKESQARQGVEAN